MGGKIKSIAQLAVPYVLIALLPILSILALCSYIVQSYTQTILEEQNAALAVAVDRVDEKMGFLEREAYFLSAKNEFRDYFHNQYIGKTNEILDCHDVQNLLHSFVRSTEVAEVYFYDAQSGRIIASSTTMNNGEMFFEYMYRPTGKTPAECLSALQNAVGIFTYTPVQSVQLNSVSKDVIEIRRTMEVGGAAKNPNQLVIALDVEKIFEDFFDAVGDDGVFNIYDGDTLLLHRGETEIAVSAELPNGTLAQMTEQEGKPYGVQYMLNNHLRVEFIYANLPQAGENRTLVLYLLMAIGIPALVCVSMCILFTHKNHRRISEILSLLRGEDPADELLKSSRSVNYKLISQYARHVVEKNSDYRTKLREFHATHKVSALTRLIQNAYRSQEEMRKSLDGEQLLIREEPCVALCVQFDEICNELFTAGNVSIRDMIANLLRTHTATKVEVLNNLPTQIVAIMAADESLDEAVESIISQLNVRVVYQYGTALRIGVGEKVPTIYEIARSYDQAREVIRYNESTGKNVRHYAQMETTETVAFYPVTADEKILNYMTAGRAEDAKDVLRDIYRENFHDQAKLLSVNAIQQIRYQAANAVIGAAQKQGVTVPGKAKTIHSETNIKQFFLDLTEIVGQITGEIASKKNNNQNNLAVRVREYIQEQYTDSALSIRQIAAEFGFHENYVSNLYKEEYGENLSAAIEKLRIEKASLLLETTDMRIGEVAEAVGYSSDSSFRRAFKKISGISPVDYRNCH